MAQMKIPVGGMLDYEGQAMETREPRIVVKLPDGKWLEYNRLASGGIGRRELAGPIAEDDHYPWTRYDFSRVKPDQPFPWKVPWTNFGFMGNLSGGAGTATIHSNGRAELQQDWIS